MSADGDAVMAAVQAAKRAIASGSGDAKPKVAKGKGKGMVPDKDHDLIVMMLRDYLFTKADMNYLLNCKTVAIVFKADEMSTLVKGLSDSWHTRKQEKDAKKEAGTSMDTTDPLPFKKVFIHASMLDVIADEIKSAMNSVKAGKLAPKDGTKEAWALSAEKALTACQVLMKLSSQEVDAYVGSLRSRYSSPMPGRAWKWELTLTDFATEAVRANWLCLVLYKDPAARFLIDQRRVYQNEAEKAMWQYLKNQPRK